MTNAALSPERDFFISYTRSDRPWAEWIGWILEAAGYSIFIDAWDFRPGANFVTEMDQGTRCRQTIAVLSQAYLDARYTKSEWAAAFADDPQGDGRKLIPVRIEDFDPSGLLKSIVYVDFVGVTSSEVATERLLQALKERGKPITPPIFPGELNLEVTADPSSSERAKPASQPAFPTPAPASDELTNPFWPLHGGIEADEQFFNCESLLKSLFELLNTNHNVALIGEHSSGKSSLLRAILRQAPKQLTVNRAPIYFDLTHVFTEADFFEDLCEAIKLAPLDGQQLVRKLKRERGEHRYLLLLDEVERFAQEGFTRSIREQLRGLIEAQDAPLKIVIAARVPLDKLFPDSNQELAVSPFENICLEQTMPSWTTETCRDFIASRLAAGPIQFTEREIDQLLRDSGGNPQQLTQAGYTLYNHYRHS